ncbi:MAG: ATP-grasp domain-containing protein [Oligoflexia bacterium]|nr:ATP-grasp domain-containing protein [Oligoflexia bacterium]
MHLSNPSKLKSNSRVAIINRGEAAVRFIKAVKEYNILKNTSISTVAYFMESDRNSPFVKKADLAIALSTLDGYQNIKGNPYLNAEFILKAIINSECDGVWPGWGFLSEDHSFVQLLEDNGLVFIGPKSYSMKLLGDKITAKKVAVEANVPILPWSEGPIIDLDDAKNWGRRIGYPVILKAANGGGGRGIRFVRSEDELTSAYESVLAETKRITGNEIIFMEALVEVGRHLEVQVAADQYANVTTFGVRDCSVQRNNQKIIEETPPSNLDPRLMQLMEESSKNLILFANYSGVATVEFIYDVVRAYPYFMEVNTRLQVEHPITEQVFGIDLVKMQLQIAMGEKLDSSTISTTSALTARGRGVAIEVRLNAEDAEKNFTPSPGLISHLIPPAGAGIRFDSGVEQGCTISSEFDSMIAKIIAWSPNREETISRLISAIDDLEIKIEKGTTNRAFLKTLLQTNGFQAGAVNTSFVKNLLECNNKPSVNDNNSNNNNINIKIETEKKENSNSNSNSNYFSTSFIVRKNWHLALVVAAIYQYEQRYLDAFSNFMRNFKRYSTPRNIFLENLNNITVSFRGKKYQFHIRRTPKSHYHIQVEGNEIIVRYFKMGPSATLFVNDQKKYVVQIIERSDFLQCEIDGIPYSIELDCQGIIRSHIPAMVLSTIVKVGDLVKKGDLLLILEAMKMEMPVLATQDGKISSMSIRLGEQVKAGQVLFEVESDQNNHSQTLVQTSASQEKSIENVENAKNVENIDFSELSVEKNNNHPEKKWEALKREFSSTFSGHDYIPSSENIYNNSILESLDNYLNEHKYIFEDYIMLLWSGVKKFIAIEKLFSKEMLLQKENARPFNYQDYLRHYFLRDIDREKGLPEKFLTAITEAIKIYSTNPSVSVSVSVSVNDIDKNQMTRHTLFRLYQSHAHLKDKELLLLNTLLKIKDLSKGRHELLQRLIGHDFYKNLTELVELTKDNNSLLADTASHLLFAFKNYNSKLETKNTKITKEYALDQLIYSNHEILFDILNNYDPYNQKFVSQILAIRNNRDIKFLNKNFFHLKDNLLITNILTEDIDFYLTIAPDQSTTVVDIYHQFFSDKNAKEKELIIYTKMEDLAQEEEYVSLIEKYNWGLYLNQLTLVTLLPTRQSIVHNFNLNQSKSNFLYLEPYKEKLFNIQLLMNFNITFLKKSEPQYIYFLQGLTNKKDERYFAFIEFPELKSTHNEQILEAVHEIRLSMAKMKKRTLLNRIIICLSKSIDPKNQNIFKNKVNELFTSNKDQFFSEVIEQYIIYYNCGIPTKYSTTKEDNDIIISNSDENSFGQTKQDKQIKKEIKREIKITFSPEIKIIEQEYQNDLLKSLSDYENKIAKSKQQGHIYPYDLISKLTATAEKAEENFEEWDLDPTSQKFISQKGRAYGQNSSNVVVGIISHKLPISKILCKRVLIIGDPSRDYGSLAEGECKAIIGAIDLAEEMNIPIEWVPFSSGARIDIKSGTENLDWTAAVLKRIINFTQNGGEINLIVAGVNVGAQSYWNAEATMLMHTNGLLIMTEKGSMLLTGKKALEYSGSVSAEDNISIGGVEKIMGPNGESQFQVKDIDEAYQLLFNHYELTYKISGHKNPTRLQTTDPFERDVNNYPYDDFVAQGLKTIGDILGTHLNAERKRPFDIRQVMKSLIDQDSFYLERWRQLENAETAVSWQTRIGGHAVGLIGIESRPLKRLGEIPNDGPDIWTGGTLFPMSSKKVARSINAFSNRLPLVVLANLSGFDGSPESLRNHQLEFGAEIGRSVVNFKGSIIFVVIARYHGGAYVVFSKRLNKNIKVLALKNTFASVIGGGAAAAVVFPRIISDRTLTNNRVKKAQKDLQAGKIDSTTYDRIYQEVESNNQLQLAKEFDQIHSIERAKEVGSIDEIIESNKLRPRIIELLSSSNS